MSTEAERLGLRIDNLADEVTEMRADLKDSMTQSVSAGVKSALTDKEFQTSFIESLISECFKQFQQGAREHTGGFIISRLKSLCSNAILFLIMGGIVYSMGGWSALGKLWIAVKS